MGEPRPRSKPEAVHYAREHLAQANQNASIPSSVRVHLSEAGVPAMILADIGGRALPAGIG